MKSGAINGVSNRWLTLAVISFGGGIVYILPYIQFSFYDQLMEATGASNVEMGNLMSVLGMASAVAYLLGGILADRFSVKWLLTISLAVTGATGLWFSTFPPYEVMMVIMVIYAVSTVFTYWPAMIKAIKLLGPDSEQGRLFGIREAGFGIFALLFTQVGTWVIYSRNEGVEGLRDITIYYAVIYLISAVLSFIFVPNSKKAEERVAMRTVWSGLGTVLRTPSVWLIGLVIFCVYSVDGAAFGSKFVPYLTGIGGVDSSTAASLSSLRMYLLSFAGAILAGFIVDKMGRGSRFLIYAYLALIASLIAFNLIPVAREETFAIIVAFIVSFVIYMMRGTYFVPISQTGLPNGMIGTAVGVISFIGFLPDAFMFTVFGAVMGDNPGEAEYATIFWSAVCIAVVGLVAAIILDRILPQTPAAKPTEHSVSLVAGA